MASVPADARSREMSAAPLILSFNTATLGGSVCLFRSGELLASISGDPSVSHSSTLLRDIDRTLEAAGVSLAEVELLAAASGPGSFTGLRIGVASIKALSIALRRPCFGIPTLQAVALGAGASKATVAVLPAGRGEVFAQLFSVSPANIVNELDTPAHLPPRALLERYERLADLKWAGEGATLHREIIKEEAARKGIDFTESTQIAKGWILVTAEADLAKNVAVIAWQRFQSGQIETAASLQAIYVRPADAEMKKNVSQ